MPIYEYACRSCDHEFERIVRAGAPNPPCPECDAQVDKKISLSSFQLKGGGWYSDAYSGQDNKTPSSKVIKGKSKPSGASGSSSSTNGSGSSGSSGSSSSGSSSSGSSGSSSSNSSGSSSSKSSSAA